MPLFQFQPAPVQPYYHNPYAGTLAELAAAPLRIQADKERAQAAISANAVNNLTSIANGAMNSYVKYQEGEPARQYQTAHAAQAMMQTRNMQRADDEDTAIREALQHANGDPDQALSTLRATGGIGVNAASKLQKQITDGRAADLKGQQEQLKMANERLGMASDYLSSLDDVPEQARPDAYARIVPKLRDLAGPQLGAQIPDQYDPTIVAQMRRMGETAAEAAQRQHLALETAKAGIDAGKDVMERDKHFTTALAQVLPTTESQEEWDGQLANMHKLGAPYETLSKFGPTWSPEAAERAASIGVDPNTAARQDNKGPQLGTFGSFLESYARDHDTTPDALTGADQLKAASQWAHAHSVKDSKDLSPERRADMIQTVMQFPSVYGDLPEGMRAEIAPDLAKAGFNRFGAASPSSVAAAERWKSNELRRVQQSLGLNEIDDQEAANQRGGIEASYQRQVGGRNGGGPPAPPAPANSAPPAVQQTLRGQRPGRYKLSDGTTWIVGPNGSIAPGR